MTEKSGRSVNPQGQIRDEDRAKLKDRLSKLDDRLDNAQSRRPREIPSQGRGKAMGYGFRMATDIIAAVVVGTTIGWYLDQWLGTKPILLLIFIAIGLAAGVRNVIRSYRVMAADLGTNTGVDTDDLSTPNKNDYDDDDKDRV